MNLKCVAVFVLVASSLSSAADYKYIRIGNKQDATAKTQFGIAMMGGGDDLDDAFRWMCRKAGGGDFLVLRAHGDDDYNTYIQGMCPLNSVATLIVDNRAAADDTAVADIVGHAEAIFISGGDQALYVKNWKGTKMLAAINRAIADGKPIGGTSAGLAVLGEFAYGALNDPDDSELHSKDALLDCYHNQVTIVRDFIHIPLLRSTLTDSHFAIRDRMGRTLVFLSRIMADDLSAKPKEIAIDEKSAVLVEADGNATVVGPGKGAYFLRPKEAPEVCRAKSPLTLHGVEAINVKTGGHFNLASWSGDGQPYTLSVEKGVVSSGRPDGTIY